MIKKTAIQAIQMGFLRFGGITLGALAQIYAARQLGPEKLGISGMALTLIAQGSILVTFGADPLLVREYSEHKSESDKKKHTQDAFSMRIVLMLIFSILIIVGIICMHADTKNNLALACVIPLVFFQSNQGLWLLQAKENMPAQYLASTLGNLLMAILIVVFIKKSSPAGTDLLLSIPGAVLCFILSWKMATKSFPKMKFQYKSIVKLLYKSKWLFLSAIVIYCYTKAEQPLLGLMRSVEELGIYRTAIQIVTGLQPFLVMFPLLLYPKLIAKKQVSLSNLFEFQKKIFYSMTAPIILLSVCTLIIAPIIYPNIFGETYKSAAIPCALLIISQFIVLLNGIFAWGLWASGKDKEMLIIMSFVGVISLLLNILLIPKYGMIGAASINLLSELFVLGLSAWYMNKIVSME